MLAVGLILKTFWKTCEDSSPLTINVPGWDRSPAGVRIYYPEHRKGGRWFSYLLLSVLRLGCCQWNWVVAGANAAFDRSLIVRSPNSMDIHQI